MKKYLSNINSQPSLIIAHNPGSLYPAHKLSEKLGIPFHFDVEDFHPGEGISKSDYDPNSNPMATLMKRLLPYADRVTFASPLIMKESLKLCHSIKYPIVINNCFPHCEFHSPADLSSEAHEKGEASSKASSTTKLRLVWYSQNINHSRGLEPLIEAIQGLRGEVALTLIGQLHDGFAASWIEPNRSFIETLEPMPQKDLHRSLVKFDIGLALEPGKDFNNEIALSNKIWAYFQSGLFILATDTNAQQQFLQEHPKHGILTSPMPNKLRDTLVKLIEKKESICGEMIQRYEAAKPFSWEHESLKVLQ